MITYTEGNLLESEAEALVNTVNTVGVMGKGVALMFKEAFSENYRNYSEACKRGEIDVGRMFVTERRQLLGPRWIINFPTKKHWRNPSRIEWIEEGLIDLKCVISKLGIKSIALPPLGSGNGGLDWDIVQSKIEAALGSLTDVDVIVYAPTKRYQNVSKRDGVRALTPARALVAELVRQYSILGMECSLLETQKLAYFLEKGLLRLGLDDPLNLQFEANKFGPYAHKLTHLLNSLDGSYLHCDKRLADAGPFDVIRFDDRMKEVVATYLSSEAKEYSAALNDTAKLIDGFQSPLGMELLATVDWLLSNGRSVGSVSSIKSGLENWPGGSGAGSRKLKIFDDRLIELALQRLGEANI